MSLAYLGEQFEIHTGGIDNVFPHHEDEIAQSAAATGRLPAVHWVHGEHLLMRGRKMAKSAGNFQRVTELVDDGLDPLALRYLALTARYRRKLDYSDESLRSAAAGLDSLRSRLRALGPPPDDGPWAAPAVLEARPAGDRPIGAAHHAGRARFRQMRRRSRSADRAAESAAPLSTEGRAFHEQFVDAIDDDLDLPRALATVREVLRSSLSDDEKRWLALDADLVLGLDLHRVWGGTDTEAEPSTLPDEIRQLVDDRVAARAARDWPRADAARTRLNELGYDVVDGPDGTRAVRRNGSD